MIRIPVTTPSRSYEVLIGSGSLAHAGESLGDLLGNRTTFVVTVPPVKKRWAKVLVKSLMAAGIKTTLLEMPDGERGKRLSTLERLAEQLVKAGAEAWLAMSPDFWHRFTCGASM
jgi:3-dehydroquinate synthase